MNPLLCCLAGALGSDRLDWYVGEQGPHSRPGSCELMQMRESGADLETGRGVGLYCIVNEADDGYPNIEDGPLNRRTCNTRSL